MLLSVDIFNIYLLIKCSKYDDNSISKKNLRLI